MQGYSDNIRSQGEFVVNMVPEEVAETLNTTAPSRVDEAQLAGLGVAESVSVAVPRIKLSPVALECDLFQMISPGRTSTIRLGPLVHMHIRTAVFIDLQRLYINPAELRLIGRMHRAGGYTTTRDLFHIERKVWPVE